MIEQISFTFPRKKIQQLWEGYLNYDLLRFQAINEMSNSLENYKLPVNEQSSCTSSCAGNRNGHGQECQWADSWGGWPQIHHHNTWGSCQCWGP